MVSLRRILSVGIKVAVQVGENAVERWVSNTRINQGELVVQAGGRIGVPASSNITSDNARKEESVVEFERMMLRQ